MTKSIEMKKLRRRASLRNSSMLLKIRNVSLGTEEVVA